MTANNTRSQLNQKLEQLSPRFLQTVVDFVDFLLHQQKQSIQSLKDLENPLEQEDTIEPHTSSHTDSKANDTNIRRGKGNILDITETWIGDDFEECLQSVYDNRSQIKA